MLCVTSVLDFILLMQNHKKSVILAETLTLKYLKISCSWTFGNCRMSYQKLKFRRQKFNFIKGKILAYYKNLWQWPKVHCEGYHDRIFLDIFSFVSINTCRSKNWTLSKQVKMCTFYGFIFLQFLIRFFSLFVWLENTIFLTL
jgi:hypothetical protein